MDFSSLSYSKSTQDESNKELLGLGERVPFLPPRALSDIGRYQIMIRPKSSLLVPVAGLALALLILTGQEKLADKLVLTDWSSSERFASGLVAKAELALENIKISKVGFDKNLLTKYSSQTVASVISVTTDSLAKSKSGLGQLAMTSANNWANFKPEENLTDVANIVKHLASKYDDQITKVAFQLALVLDKTEAATASVGVTSLLEKNNVDLLSQTVSSLTNTRSALISAREGFDHKVAAFSLMLASALVATGDQATVISKTITDVSATGFDLASRYARGLAALNQLTNENTKVVAGLIKTADRTLMASAESSAYGLQATAISTREALKAVWYGVPVSFINQLGRAKDLVIDVLVETIDNWRGFIFGGTETLEVAPATGATASDLREQIRQEVIDELAGEMDSVFSRLRAGKPAIIKQPTGSDSGVVIVPATGSGRTDSDVKTRLQGMFSDPVSVRFDADGQSGIVTPEFRDRTGDNYIFLLTPLNK